MFTLIERSDSEGYDRVIVSDAASVDALYAALSKTNQEPAVREFLEAIRPKV